MSMQCRARSDVFGRCKLNVGHPGQHVNSLSEPFGVIVNDPPFIVAEVAKNWIDGAEIEEGLIAERFQHVIAVNHDRGYRLVTFSLHRLMTRPDQLNETIVAVFERRPESSPV